MRITVKNEDRGRTAEVLVEEFKVGHRLAGPASGHFVHIGPGQSMDFYIHAAKRISITEDPNATIERDAAGGTK
jgi:hypothetical protein